MIKSYKIPKGLHKCEECGEYNGEAKERVEKSEKYLTVFCLCDGILCPRCKKKMMHRPISNSYNPKDGDIVHHPYFTGMMGCGKCREK